jgi:two-component system, OmpR family, sensor kinase
VPIRIRLGLSFAAVTLLLVAVGGFLFVRSFRNGLESSLEPGLRRQLSALAQSVRDGVPSADLGSEGGGALRSGDDVAQLLDADGDVIATTREAGNQAVIDRSVAAAAREEKVFTNVVATDEGEPFRLLAAPISTPDGGRIAVVATSLEETDVAVARVRRAVLVGGGIAIAVAGFGGWLLARAALRPVERLRREAADITEHDSQARLRVPNTRDEIAALATTMNTLLENLQNALERQRAFVADAGHELRTPLGVLRTELELARRPQRTRAQLEDAIEHAAGETDRLVALTEELLLLARTDEGAGSRTEATALLPVLENSAVAMRARAHAVEVTISVEGDPTVSAAIAPTLLRRAVDNLLDNAVRYSPPGGGVTVRLQRANGDAVIDVIDEGPGFPGEFLPHAFERFRRADDARSRDDGGTGLGLAIVLAVARSHGGSAEAANRSPHGAVVSVRLPEDVRPHIVTTRPLQAPSRTLGSGPTPEFRVSVEENDS